MARRQDGSILYIKTYNSLKKQIQSGELRAGTRLLSKRLMAEASGISVNTVDSAYQQLVSEGYLDARPRSGYYVADLGPLIRLPRESPEADVQPFRLPFHERLVNIDQTSHHENKNLIDFSPNAVDLRAFPHAKFKKQVRDCMESSPELLFAPCDATGTHSLRDSLCRYLRSSRGLNCHPDQILIGAGTDFILQLLVQIIQSTTSISSIAMENPLYNKAYQIFSSLNIPVRLIPVEKNGLRTDLLRNIDANLIYLTPSHQFPLGFILPINKRTEILSWAAEKPDRYIIEDDYDSEFRYAGRPIPAISESDTQGRVIYLGTFSKSLSPSIRVSYLVLPDQLMRAFRDNLPYYTTTVSSPEQMILSSFIESGEFERHIGRMRILYRKKRDILLDALSVYRKRLIIRGTDAGLHLILRVDNGMSEEDLSREARHCRVCVYGISSYYVKRGISNYDSIPESTVILGYAGLSNEEIRKGVSLLAKAWNL
jgi:GntR family transcriptional regulator/MocR family aminotransferase